jgi:hypothetical protein
MACASCGRLPSSLGGSQGPRSRPRRKARDLGCLGLGCQRCGASTEPKMAPGNARAGCAQRGVVRAEPTGSRRAPLSWGRRLASGWPAADLPAVLFLRCDHALFCLCRAVGRRLDRSRRFQRQSPRVCHRRPRRAGRARSCPPASRRRRTSCLGNPASRRGARRTLPVSTLWGQPGGRPGSARLAGI